MKILVVEDEKKIANSIKRGLEQESWIVDVAHDGEMGHDLASSGIYDLIVMDLMLPKKDGVSVVQELRKAGIHTPVLILTAKGELSDKVEGFINGADDYMVKPFAFEELTARVKAIARRPKIITNQVLRLRDLTLNTTNFEVARGNAAINLSKKEFVLLEYLLRNRNKVVSKENIIDHVWDYDSNILPNTVEVFIASLREKIGRGVIKTVRGFGYSIE